MKIYYTAISDPIFSNIINNTIIRIVQNNRMSYMKPSFYTPFVLPRKFNFTNSYKDNNSSNNTHDTIKKVKIKQKKRVPVCNNNKKRVMNTNTTETIKMPKHPYDFYTPRIVRGKGLKRIGKCPCCPQEPGTWYKTKTSAYRLLLYLIN